MRLCRGTVQSRFCTKKVVILVVLVAVIVVVWVNLVLPHTPAQSAITDFVASAAEDNTGVVARAYQIYRHSVVWSEGYAKMFHIPGYPFDFYCKFYDKRMTKRHMAHTFTNSTVVIGCGDQSWPGDFWKTEKTWIYQSYQNVFAINLDRSKLTAEQQQRTIALPLGVDFHTVEMSESGSWGLPHMSWDQQLHLLLSIRHSAPALHARQRKILVTWTNTSTSSRRHTEYKQRPKLHHEAESNPNVFSIPLSKAVNRNHTWVQMSETAFVYAPIGNGYDTHRMWEALLLGCIVVAQDSPVVREFVDRFPIVVHNNPAQITQADLAKWLRQFPESASIKSLSMRSFFPQPPPRTNLTTVSLRRNLK